MPSPSAHIILIDGESGSGKSTLALTMAEQLSATVVHLDCAYPGWDGLVDGRDAIISDVLDPLRRGSRGEFREWDWDANTPSGIRVVEFAEIVIVEGSGISTPRSRTLADTTIWVSCDASTRRNRIQARDHGAFDEYWNEWDTQVRRHIVENDPIGTATLVINS